MRDILINSKSPIDSVKADEVRPGLRVLVVADDPISLTVLARLLERIGCSVEAATNVSSAAWASERRDHDLILLDVLMPGVDGRSALAEIRRAEAESGFPQVPILSMTPPRKGASHPCSLEVGLDGHLTTPFTLRSLRESLIDWTGPARDSREGFHEPVEVERLLERCGGDRGLAAEIIDVCLATIPASIRMMADAVGSEDFRRLAIEVHGLKGGARTIGSEDLEELCTALERVAEVEDREGCRRALADFVLGWNCLRSAMVLFSRDVA